MHLMADTERLFYELRKQVRRELLAERSRIFQELKEQNFTAGKGRFLCQPEDLDYLIEMTVAALGMADRPFGDGPHGVLGGIIDNPHPYQESIDTPGGKVDSRIETFAVSTEEIGWEPQDS